MMMINSKVYKGIEFIQLSELPQAQRQSILQTISHDLFIKIMIDGKIVDQCLQYKDYCSWYKNIYQHGSSAKREEIITEENVALKAKLAFK